MTAETVQPDAQSPDPTKARKKDWELVRDGRNGALAECDRPAFQAALARLGTAPNLD